MKEEHNHHHHHHHHQSYIRQRVHKNLVTTILRPFAYLHVLILRYSLAEI